jgi:hypothetical protein
VAAKDISSGVELSFFYFRFGLFITIWSQLRNTYFQVKAFLICSSSSYIIIVRKEILDSCGNDEDGNIQWNAIINDVFWFSLKSKCSF